MKSPRTVPLRPLRPALAALALLLLGTVPAGCTALQTLAVLDEVDLSLEGVSGGRLAGVDLSGYRSLTEVRATDLLRIGSAYRQGDLPLELTLHVGAENPLGNRVDAHLERLDWTLRLNDRRAASGVVDRPIVLPAGRLVEVPVDVRVDLLDLYSDSRDDLIALALRLIGRGADAQRLELTVQPTITTPLGPITYPREIVLTRRDV